MLYGAAEFSRDTDLAILADTENLERLRAALAELQADCIAVPPFEMKYLEMGLAAHFRCRHPDAENMRIDIMSKMRGVDLFPELWARRTTIEFQGTTIETLSLPDLVSAKKTQRDKYWPMITRLIEANYFSNRIEPTNGQVTFWLSELRTPVLLIEVAQKFPDVCERLKPQRSLLEFATTGDEGAVRIALHKEEVIEREKDQQYWLPLRDELQRLRREAHSSKN